MGFTDKTGYSSTGFVRLFLRSSGEGNSIISDSALYLDARNNTATGTHDNNASVWIDTADTANVFNADGCNWTESSLIIPADSSANGHTPEISQGTVELALKTSSVSYSDNIALVADDGTVVTDIAPYNADTQYHIAVTFADTVSVYVDGAKVKSNVDIASLRDTNGYIEFSIGIDGIEDTFEGEICSSRVYNRVLTDNEIRNNYLYDIKRY